MSLLFGCLYSKVRHCDTWFLRQQRNRFLKPENFGAFTGLFVFVTGQAAGVFGVSQQTGVETELLGGSFQRIQHIRWWRVKPCVKPHRSGGQNGSKIPAEAVTNPPDQRSGCREVLLDFHRRRGLAAIKTIEIENDLGN